MTGFIILGTIIIAILIIYLFFRYQAISEKEINAELEKHEYYFKTNCIVSFLYSNGSTSEYEKLHRFKMILYAFDYGLLLIRASSQTYGPYSLLFIKQKEPKFDLKKVSILGKVYDIELYSNKMNMITKVFARFPYRTSSTDFIIEFDGLNIDIEKLAEFGKIKPAANKVYIP